MTPRIASPTRVVTNILPALDPKDAKKAFTPPALPDPFGELVEELVGMTVEVIVTHCEEPEHET